MKAKQEFIINKIKEACPELMELSFGCAVQLRVNDSWFPYNEEIYHILKRDNTSIDESYFLCGVDQAQFSPPCMEIIGHPPQLNHLLKTFKTFKNIVESELLYVFRVCAEGFILWKEIGKPIVKVEYNFSKSVLENLQNPILVDFLADVMGYAE